jgi:hypothetical protein
VTLSASNALDQNASPTSFAKLDTVGTGADDPLLNKEVFPAPVCLQECLGLNRGGWVVPTVEERTRLKETSRKVRRWLVSCRVEA